MISYCKRLPVYNPHRVLRETAYLNYKPRLMLGRCGSAPPHGGPGPAVTSEHLSVVTSAGRCRDCAILTRHQKLRIRKM